MNKGKMKRIATLNNMIENAEETLKDLKCRLSNETDESTIEILQDKIEEVEDYINHYESVLSAL